MWRVVVLLGMMMMANGGAHDAGHGWAQTAGSAQRLAPSQLDDAEERISRLPEADRTAVARALDGVAAVARGVGGVNAAQAKIKEEGAKLSDPNADGPTPAFTAFRQASRSVLQGVVYQSGLAVRTDDPTQAVALIAAVRGIDVLGQGATAILVQEVRQGLGPELYVESLKKAAP